MPYDKSLREYKELRLCEDGSYTLYSTEFDEPYHSTKDGALHESLEKHVKPALSLKRDKKELKILDICFGLGYNTLATIYYLKQQRLDIKIDIISPEFDRELITSLADFEYPAEFDSIRPIISAISKELHYEDEQFRVDILLGDARESIPQIKQKIDIVYQDAFSPAHNPLLWTREYFTDIRAICSDDAILTTYSVAAAVRLAMYENGFYIFIHRADNMRYATVASLEMLDGMEYVNMELKKIRNPNARSLRDKEFVFK